MSIAEKRKIRTNSSCRELSRMKMFKISLMELLTSLELLVTFLIWLGHVHFTVSFGLVANPSKNTAHDQGGFQHLRKGN